MPKIATYKTKNFMGVSYFVCNCEVCSVRDMKAYGGGGGIAPIVLNLLKSTGYVTHNQFNIQQL